MLTNISEEEDTNLTSTTFVNEEYTDEQIESVRRETRETMWNEIPIRIEFRLKNHMRAFDAINNHRNIFIEMKKIDPEIEFHGRKNAIIKDLSEFPESRESYEQIFEHCNNPPGPIRMVVAVHSIRTKKSFTELKFDNPAMMRYLTENFHAPQEE